MITLKQYTYEDKYIWNNFLKNSKNGMFMFYREYMEYHSDRFIDNSILFYQEDTLVAILPMTIKENCLYSHGGLTFGGFITNKKMKQHKMLDCFYALQKYIKSNNIKSLIYKSIPYIYQLQPAEEDIYSLYNIGAKISKIEAATLVNLRNPLKMPKGRSAQVKRAKREGVIVEESTEFNSFIELENKILADYHNSKAVHTGKELLFLHNNFPENIKLYVGKYKNEVIAGSVVFIYDNVVHTQYLAANDIARKIGALDYVVATMMDKYRESKLWFDFGKSTEEDGKLLNEGLIAQKEGFGGRTFVYTTWELTC